MVRSGFSKEIGLGESATVYFQANASKPWVEEEDLYYFGFNDTFGRLHWCSRANAKKFRKDVVEDFGAVEPHRPGRLDTIKASATKRWNKVASAAARTVPIKTRFRRKA